jgi:hypothetical protein
MTVTWLLATVMGNNKINNAKRCRNIAGNFDHHGDALVQSRAHCPVKHIKASLEAIGQVPTLYHPGSCHGCNFGRKHTKITAQVLSPFWQEKNL